MNLPTVNTIESALRVSEADAKAIRAALEKGRDAWANTWNHHKEYRAVHSALTTIDQIYGSSGVETMQGRGGDVLYCNSGDTYAPTVIYDFKTNTFRITTQGDLVERYPARFCD